MSPQDVGVLTAALFAKRNLGWLIVLGLSVVLFRPLLIGVAAVIYGVRVASTYKDPAFRRQALDEAAYVRGDTKVPPVRAGTGPARARLEGRYLELRNRAAAIVADANRQLDSLSDPFVRDQFAPLRPQLEGLAARIATLCGTAQQLAKAATPEAETALQAEVAALRAKAAGTTDEQARGHYEAALVEKGKLLESLAGMRQAAERMDAELASLGGALERARADIMRIVAASTTGAKSGPGELPLVSSVSDQVSAIEATVNELEALEEDDRRASARARVS